MKLRDVGWDEVSLLILSVFFVYFLWHSLTVLFYPLWLDEYEGFMLDSTIRVFSGGFLYDNVLLSGSRPYPYPPLFNVFSAFLMLFTGKVLAAGRLLSLLASLLCGLVLFKIVLLLTGNRFNAAVFSLLFYTSRFVFLWSPLFRVDMLAVFFSLCGIYCALKENHNVFYPALFFTFALFTKQSFIAAPFAVFINYFLTDKKAGVKFISTYLSLVFFVFVLLNFLTSGEFVLHTVVYNMHHFSFEVAILLVFMFFILHLPVFLGAVYSVCKGRLSIVSIYLIFSVMFSLSVGKDGAYFNYFIEPFAAMIISSSVLFHSSNRLLQLFLVVFCISFFIFSSSIDYIVGLSDSRVEEFNKMVSSISARGNVLSEDPQVTMALGGLVSFDPFLFSRLEQAGFWDSSFIASSCRSREFSAVVFYEENSKMRLFPELLDCVRTTYNKTGVFNVSGVKYAVYQ